jgi:endonuclease YncB( thermonuclease family)
LVFAFFRILLKLLTYRQYAKEQSPQDREDYEIAEFNAKVRRLGLWADTKPVPPWEWRHS